MGMNNGGGCTYKVFVLSHTKNAQFSSVLCSPLIFSYFIFNAARFHRIKFYICVCECVCVKIKSRCSFYSLNAIRRISISTNHSERGRTHGMGVLLFSLCFFLIFIKRFSPGLSRKDRFSRHLR